MLFNSLPFLTSFLLFLTFYSLLNKKWQNIALLLYGFYFYSYWNWKMSLLLVLSILFNFYIGKFLNHKNVHEDRKRVLIFGIVINLIILCFFKYTLFFLDLVVDIANVFSHSISIWRPEILLPVGISFYTFHNISYLIEIKNENIAPSENLVTFSVYDIFFPLLLAGPIERPNSLLPQLESNRKITKEGIYKGFSIFAWGIFLKTVIADPLAKFVDGALNQNGDLPDGILWIVAPAFAFQVYADFSGYSNCARGLAYIMGFKLMNNFHRPFFASNPVEFWQRWHISLSSWLRDYVYIPLGGNRKGFLRQNINILLVWILGGLWHGATYGYLLWGIYLGICIVIYNIIKKYFMSLIPRKLSLSIKIVGFFLTFFSFSFGLLLFRIHNYEELLIYCNNIISIKSLTAEWFFVFLYFIPILIFDLWQEGSKTLETDWQLQNKPIAFWLSFSILFLIFSLVSPFAKQEFFYFQF